MLGVVDGDFVAHVELVEPGGHRPVRFELVDAAAPRHDAAVKRRVAPGWPAAVGSFLRRLATWWSFSGMLALIPRRRR